MNQTIKDKFNSAKKTLMDNLRMRGIYSRLKNISYLIDDYVTPACRCSSDQFLQRSGGFLDN